MIRNKKNTSKNPVVTGFEVFRGIATFHPADTGRILQISTAQNSLLRKSYNFRKRNPEATTAECATAILPRFKSETNRFYFNSIQGDIDRLIKSKRKVIFGGKKNWQLLQEEKITKKQWQALRDRRLVSAGDHTQNGNRNIQVCGETIRVNDPAKRGKWITGDIQMFQREIPPETWNCYRVHLNHHKGLKFQVTVTVQKEMPNTFTPLPGAIGIDINPNHIDWVETNSDGNPIDQGTIWLHRMTTAKSGKREYDARQAAIELSQLCLAKQKMLAHENLNFGKKTKRPPYKRRCKRFNRMRHNFSYRLILAAINSRCKKDGVPVKETIAAYSSILGLAKFSQMRGMNRHNSAALIIARRGMGIERERQNFSIETIQLRNKGEPRKVGKPTSGRPQTAENPTSRQGMVIRLKPKSIETLTRCFLRPSASLEHSKKNGGDHSPLSRKPAKLADRPKRSRKTQASMTMALPLTQVLARVPTFEIS